MPLWMCGTGFCRPIDEVDPYGRYCRVKLACVALHIDKEAYWTIYSLTRMSQPVADFLPNSVVVGQETPFRPFNFMLVGQLISQERFDLLIAALSTLLGRVRWLVRMPPS